jgi:hypothetical protein
VAISHRVLGGVAGAAAVCLLSGLLAGCTESRPEGVHVAKVVGTETDSAGRVVKTLVDVEFVMQVSTSQDTCSVDFFDAAGTKLDAPNDTTLESGYNPLREEGNGSDKNRKRKFNQQIKVSGVPRTAKLNC